MKFETVPGATPVFGLEIVDLALVALAVPALLGIFIGLRRETAVFTVWSSARLWCSRANFL